MGKKLRGSGVRHTIPHIGRFAGLWLLVTISAVLVAAIFSYLLFSEGMGEAARPGFLRALVVQTGLIVVAVIALGIFTTHRLAGPWIAVKRALEGVSRGDVQTPLRIRAHDTYMKDVEVAFNDMVGTLRQKQSGRSDAA